MTEWVTIKVPKATRDKARDDPRTYEEILQDGLGVERDGWQPSDGAGYIPTEERSGGEVGVDTEALASEIAESLNGFEWHIDTQEVSSEVVAKLDYVHLASKTAEELEGRLR